MHFPMYFLCAKVRGYENKHIHMSFDHRLFIVTNLMSSIKSIIFVMDYQVFLYFYVSPNYQAQ